ncbi:MAG TPA: hypothetical protein VFY80_05945, partial [Burkholderiales bacterium]|nr:hypothetical protein [Burkholderiales bacterium]
MDFFFHPSSNKALDPLPTASHTWSAILVAGHRHGRPQNNPGESIMRPTSATARFKPWVVAIALCFATVPQLWS